MSCPTVGWAQIDRIVDLDAEGAREAGERQGWRESKERSDVPIIWDVSPCQEKATFFLTKCRFGLIEKLMKKQMVREIYGMGRVRHLFRNDFTPLAGFS